MSEMATALILALVQGITEALPISSSAHLILVSSFWGEAGGLPFEVAVHFGTLLAISFYFRKTLFYLIKGGWQFLLGRPSRFYSNLAWQLLIATFPVALAGWLLHDFIAMFRSPFMIAWMLIGFGLLLWASDAFFSHSRTLRQLTWKGALVIGIAQILALIPGVSRSGITLTAALALGLNRTASATFSFLLSIPVVLLATLYETYKITRAPMIPTLLNPYVLIMGISVAGVTAYAGIHLFFQLIRKIGMWPFAIYRLLLGLLLLHFFSS